MATTRRHFLQAGSIAGLGLAGMRQSPAAAAQQVSPNDRIQIATVGVGGMGMGDTETAADLPGVKLVAAADVYQGRLDRTRERWGSDVFITRDYREVLARSDVDAVIIATPDHWHAQMAIDALNAGKDVYLQKPMIQKAEEGPLLVEAARKTGRILQVGSQRVSSIIYAKTKELYESGAIGQLNLVEAWWDRNSAQGAWQYSIPLDATPENIDWDRFLGHAPKAPFEPVRLFRWRNYRDYGTGVAGDLFVHLFSGIHYALSSVGPTRIFSGGGLRFWKDGRDVPDVMLGLFDYPAAKFHPAFTLALRVNFVSGGGESHGFRFVGSEGIMTILGGVSLAKPPKESEPGYTIGTFPQSVQEAFLKDYRAKYPERPPTPAALGADYTEKYVTPPGYSDQVHHHQNFVHAVRSRQPVVEDAAFGFRAAGPAVLCNTSYFETRVCEWDPQQMKVASSS